MAVQDIIELKGLKAFTERLYRKYILKQDKLNWDTEPTEGSMNPVTSDGVYKAVNSIQIMEDPVVYTTGLPDEGDIEPKIYGVWNEDTHKYDFYAGKREDQTLIGIAKQYDLDRVETKVEDVQQTFNNTIGSIACLTTEHKENVVAAINELDDRKNKMTTKNLTVTENARIEGNLYVEGMTVSQSNQQVTTKSNYVTTRDGMSIPLVSGEHSGLVINNYAADKLATATVDSEGTWRISAGASASTTVHTDISFYDGAWYESITRTLYSGVSSSDLFTDVDGDEVSSTVYYATTNKYYTFKDSYWYDLIIDGTNHLTTNEAVTTPATITALEALTRSTLTYFRSITVNVIDNSTNQALLTRAEEADLTDGKALAWDATTKKAVSGNFKPVQTPVTDPTASGNTLAFIDSISQDENGVVTATKKNVKVTSSYSSTGTDPVNGAAIKEGIDGRITSDVPSTVNAGAGSAGDSTNLARADHKHQVSTATASSIGAASGPTFGSNATGDSSSLARANHTHQVRISTANASTIGTVSGSTFGSNTEGDSSSLARANHTHQVRLPVFSGATGSASGSAGLVKAPAKGDHTKFLRGDGTWSTVTAAAINIETCHTEGPDGWKTTASGATTGVMVVKFIFLNSAVSPYLNGLSVRAFGTVLQSENAGLLWGTCIFVLDGTFAHLISSESGFMLFRAIHLQNSQNGSTLLINNNTATYSYTTDTYSSGRGLEVTFTFSGAPGACVLQGDYETSELQWANNHNNVYITNNSAFPIKYNCWYIDPPSNETVRFTGTLAAGEDVRLTNQKISNVAMSGIFTVDNLTTVYGKQL